MNRPFDPFGRGPRPPGMPNMGPRGRNSTPDFINHLEQDYGADKLVRLEYKKISNDQAKKIGEILEPYMVAKSYTSFFDPNINSYVFMFPYDGDLNELAAKITFGEVDQVLAKERRIRLKSITLP